MEPHTNISGGLVSQELHPGELGSWEKELCSFQRRGSRRDLPNPSVQRWVPENESRKRRTLELPETWSLE